MARQLRTYVTGAIGPVIFYEFRGVPVSRSKPKRVRQTKATKAAAKDFGRAVRYSRLIRESLTGLLAFPKDKKMMYSLNSVLLKILRESKGDSTMMANKIRLLYGFEFNEDSRLSNRLRIKPVVDFSTRGKIVVDIPALKPIPDIQAPAHTHSLQWTIMAVRCNIKDLPGIASDPPDEYRTVLDMKYNDTRIPPQRLELLFRSIPGDIVLVVIGLTFFTMKQKSLLPVMDKRWAPAGVVGVRYEG